MSTTVTVERIDTHSNTRKRIEEPVALEAPINIFVDNHYVITLLATPEFQKELALGWLFDEGILQSLGELEKVEVQHDSVKVMLTHPIEEEKLRAVSVSRLFTTACGLSAREFFDTIGGGGKQLVVSDYQVKAADLIEMVQKLNEARLFRASGGVHTAALFEEENLVALAEDVGRHNAIDKVVGIGIQSGVDFSNSMLASSGRQPADMVLKAARIGVPIVASRAAPIRSGIIAAEEAGVTLVCFVRDQRMNVYSHPHRILLGNEEQS